MCKAALLLARARGVGIDRVEPRTARGRTLLDWDQQTNMPGRILREGLFEPAP